MRADHRHAGALRVTEAAQPAGRGTRGKWRA